MTISNSVPTSSEVLPLNMQRGPAYTPGSRDGPAERARSQLYPPIPSNPSSYIHSRPHDPGRDGPQGQPYPSTPALNREAMAPIENGPPSMWSLSDSRSQGDQTNYNTSIRSAYWPSHRGRSRSRSPPSNRQLASVPPRRARSPISPPINHGYRNRYLNIHELPGPPPEPFGRELLANQQHLMDKVMQLEHEREQWRLHQMQPDGGAGCERGRPATRGGNAKAKQRALNRMRRGLLDGQENTHDVVTTEASAGQEDLGKIDGLSVEARKARRELQTETTRKFRFVCGIFGKDLWPTTNEVRVNPDTKEQYRTPDFTHDVNHPTNIAIFRLVARLISDEFKDVNNAPECLTDPRFHWNRATVESLAKASFHTFKKDWKAQINNEARLKKLAHQRSTRWYQRRVEKQARRVAISDVYKEKHGYSPADLMYLDHMSDDASGPEDEAVESFDMWKIRMAREAGIDPDKLSAQNFAKFNFFENVKQQWRSDELSEIVEHVHEMCEASRPSEGSNRPISIRVRSTGRYSDAAPTKHAPYNFGINKQWYDEHKDLPEYMPLFADWYKWGDPEWYASVYKGGTSCDETSGAGMGGVALRDGASGAGMRDIEGADG